MADYEVGYGKPPESGKFKPGQSGNRKGPKPKEKRTEKASSIARRLGSEEVSINGTKFTFDELIYMNLRNQAAKGSLPAIKAYYVMQRELGLLTPAAATGGGVLVVPGMSGIAEWTEIARLQQAKFRGEDPEGLAALEKAAGINSNHRAN